MWCVLALSRVPENGTSGCVSSEGWRVLGFDFRRTLSNNGVWRPQYTPRLKQRTALLRQCSHPSSRFASLRTV